MRRSTLLVTTAATLWVAVAGCNAGSISMVGADAGPVVADAEAVGSQAAFLTRVLPLLEDNCITCHASTTTDAPPFMVAEPDVYTTVNAWPSIVNRRDPGFSRLITKGEHRGPAWTTSQIEIIRGWIEIEVAENPPVEGDPTYLTDPHQITEGHNQISLESLRIPGTSLIFRARRQESGWLLEDLEVWAGAGGARLTHPVMVIWDGVDPLPDVADTFAGIDVMVEPFGRATVGGGTMMIVNDRDPLRFSFIFDAASPLTGPIPEGDGGVPTGGADGGVVLPGGCTNLSGFMSNAAPQFTAYCVGCHGGGRPEARAALDMSTMGDAASCAQILGRMNEADPRNSIIFLRPDPFSGVPHLFKLDPTQIEPFRAAILAWYETE